MRLSRFACLFVIFLSALCLANSNPVPLVYQPLVPASIQPGSKGFTLTVNGNGFASGAVVNWNGAPRETEVLSSSQIKAKITAADVAKAGTASVAVVNSGPGGGPSNVVYFPIRKPSKSVGLTRDSSMTEPNAIAVGDFNNDGNIDVALSPREGTIEVFLGKGDGTFQAPISSHSGILHPRRMFVADFNGDGNLDVFAYAGTSDKGSVFFGDGTGKLKQGPVVNTFTWEDIAVGDFNHDGKLDLVATTEFQGVPEAYIYLGNGDGTFTVSTGVNSGPGTTAIGDFNGDGNFDLAIPDGHSGQIDVYLGDGTGNFTGPTSYRTANGGTSAATADINGDGKLDLITDGVSVLLGNGDGTFTADGGVSVGFGVDQTVNVGDFNGDGKLDVAIAAIDTQHRQTISVLLGKGDGTFQKPISLPAGVQQFDGRNGFGMGDFNDDGKLDLILSGRKAFLALQSSVSINPVQLTFPDQNLNTTSKPQTSVLTNLGSSALTINSIGISGADAKDFTQKNNCGSSLPPNHSCKINVSFTPTATGLRTASVSVDYQGAGSPAIVALTGTGVDRRVSLNPSKLDFSTQLVGTTSSQQTVTLTNIGAQAVTISSISANAPFAETDNCPATLNPSDKCQIQVRFTPTGKGVGKGILSAYDDAKGDPQKVALTGTGTVVKLTPISVNFGDQKVGTKSSPVPIRLTNEGKTSLSLSKIAITGTDAGDFTQTNNCGTNVPAGHSCTIKATFDPQGTGQRSAAIAVRDDGGGSPQQVPLAGTGT